MVTHWNKLILSQGECACKSVHATRLHHQDFPELWVECGTPADAVEHLLNQFARALDGASSRRHRESCLKAIAEVKAFAQHFDLQGGGRKASPCRSPLRDEHVMGPRLSSDQA